MSIFSARNHRILTVPFFRIVDEFSLLMVLCLLTQLFSVVLIIFHRKKCGKEIGKEGEGEEGVLSLACSCTPRYCYLAGSILDVGLFNI